MFFFASLKIQTYSFTYLDTLFGTLSPSAAGKGCHPWEVRGCRGFLQVRKNP